MTNAFSPSILLFDAEDHSLRGYCLRQELIRLDLELALLEAEDNIESLAFEVYGLERSTLGFASVYSQIGLHPWQYPLSQEFEAFNKISDELSQMILLAYDGDSDITLSLDDDMTPSLGNDEYDFDAEDNQQPVAQDTQIGQIARQLSLHPKYIHMAIRDALLRQDVVPAHQKDALDDCFSCILLRLLGHRWPKQIEAGEPVPAWADADGIIPLTGDTDEPTLLDRVRERIPAEFEGGDGLAIEREFAEIMGRSLETWLTTKFFSHHTRQFKKRPIAWQIQSGRFTTRQTPAFACLVYYHKLDGATLTTLQSQYVRPLRQRYETELRGIESLPADARSARQDARRLELQEAIRELEDFDAALGQVATEGFASQALAKIVAQEPLDRWCAIDGAKPPPQDREALLRQEKGYIPDINDGVRVNIAPLQKAGLLADKVLSKKDMGKAIADRAAWRADERRWCREGKLPRPGWWE